MQQATPQELLTHDYQLVVQQDSDTANPRTPIPVFYIHAGNVPFCDNLRCFCQAGKRAGAILYQDIAAGKLRLAQYLAGQQQPNIVDQAIVQNTYTLLDEDTPHCFSYGHSWELTESPDVKECTLCHMRGYCPGCTPQRPAGAQPFSCSEHAGRQGEQ